MEHSAQDKNLHNDPCTAVEVLIDLIENEGLASDELDRMLPPLSPHINGCECCQKNIRISMEFLSYLCQGIYSLNFPLSDKES